MGDVRRNQAVRCDKDVGKMCEGEGFGNGGRGCLGLEVQRVATT